MTLYLRNIIFHISKFKIHISLKLCSQISLSLKHLNTFPKIMIEVNLDIAPKDPTELRI